MPAAAVSLQRKKSLPDVAQPIQLTATAPLSREEVSVLSSMRREEIRRQIDESERLRANPLLYLVSPQVKVRLVLSAAAGDAGGVHQHILRPDVLQAADVAASRRLGSRARGGRDLRPGRAATPRVVTEYQD
ncbi:hypothetical protein WN48_10687 [Eufriesea mexicana]|nr:hypothetical protein WN48_10687 [Eufriesea mexicana]